MGPQGTVWISAPIPHTTGLCRAHHDAVEDHDAKILLVGGTWTWHDSREPTADETGAWSAATGEHPDSYPVDCWEEVGPLNPQPGSREGKAKRKRFQGEARRKRKVISIRVPDDAGEDGAALIDEAVAELEAKLTPNGEPRPIYFTIKNALDFTLLNADETDFE